MARSLTPKDAHTLMTAIVRQATGQDNITVVDTSSFVSAGETVLATGIENTLNALGIVMGKTLMAVRPYEAKFKIINALNSDLYTSRVRKISFYAQNPQASGDWNTDLYTNLARGYDNGSNGGNSTASMWEQKPAIPLEMNFGGQDVWDDQLTVYENQLKVAFRDENEFISFMNGAMTEKGNDIEQEKEGYSNMLVLNKIASVYDMQSVMPNSVCNLTKLFNDEYGTTYDTATILQSHKKELLKLWVSEFKIISDRMTRRSTNYHWSVPKTVGGVQYDILRHTPKDKQRTMLYAPFFAKAEADVLPEIFSPQYLKNPAQGEMVDFWQSINDPSSIKVTPAVTNTSTGVQEQGNSVNIPYVLGMLYDEDALMVDFQYEDSLTTPVEARKRFRNIFWHFSKNGLCDPTENCVIFIMEDYTP